ncbi:methyl-accepting chemotaxis protein [Bradyrhizobium cenepequi]|uniref:methyl-accepting chemotaxis protein n=1 Tax=Bradyrhizobium cenepequi TaxID=2821403 RepID=UPI001CE23715|nr:methyl-accepting chemotaxis protein [Bradyrhizobium cenepequi]MCA6106722.1 cache domain-containing protein [Bradyrhizobium cenepequi]
MRHKLTIGKKLFLIVLIFATVLACVTSYMLLDMRSGMFEDRKTKLRALVETAVNTVNRYGDLAAAGKMPLEEAQKTALTVLAGMNFDGKNYFFVFDRKGIMKMHPSRKDNIGQNMLEMNDDQTRANYSGYLEAANKSASLEGFSQFLGRRPGSTVNDTPKLFLSAVDKHWDWVVTTGIFIDDVNAIFLNRAFWVLGTLGAGLSLSLVITILLGRSITRPLNRTVVALEELSAGKFDTEVSSDGSKTEIGRLNRAFVQFREKMKETEALRASQANAEKLAELERRNAMLRFADDFETAVGSLVDALFTEIEQTSQTVTQLSKSARDSAAGTERMNSAASSVSENIQTVAAASQELAASINEIGRQIHLTRDIAQETRTRSSETERRVAALSDSVQAIGTIIEIINSIAEQTNLLALNATIEAARAGEAGRGFSVVASEVKALATQTTKATEDISKNIEKVRAATTEAVDAVRAISASINGLDESASTIAAAVEEQNAATSEISRNTTVTAEQTVAITGTIADVACSVNGTDHSAREVEQHSTAIRGRFEDMRREVNAFLGRIRAA